MASRKLSELLPQTQKKAEAWIDECRERGLNVWVTCTYRGQEEQDVLYLQGRKTLEEVNQARKSIGLYEIKESENKKVTWTRNSKHKSRRALDFALDVKGQEWNLKIDMNQNQIPDFEEAGKLAIQFGFIWGGTWEDPDYPHIQDDEEYPNA